MGCPSIAGQEIVAMLNNIFEVKDAYTAGHSKRVALYCSAIAQAMGLNKEEQNIVYQAGLLHDIGKILTPEAILLKPRRFGRKEYSIMQNHSTDGETMINFIPSFKVYAQIVRHHHERYDGRGYPDGLCAEEIPLLSRIMTIADAYDAMTTNRIYRARKNLSEAIFEIDRCSGTQFDPEVAKYAISVFCSHGEGQEFPEIGEFVIEEERFAYFFKDTLTSAYTGEYLNHFLNKHKIKYEFEDCLLVQAHHMHRYNEHFGWKSGDKVLIEIALRLKILFATNTIFRLFGDDFIVLNPLHVGLSESEILKKLGKGFTGIELSLMHVDCKHHKIEKWEQFEKYLKKNSSQKTLP
ncbi:MAG: HD domain-containing protein [Sulfurospirillaceae bacterium]|nr:HD domain-containing protein [Sulfurospirillaceae bacterium]MDD2826727.1 HD domain-containing protein [Sulfurospirillaceae bacterium]